MDDEFVSAAHALRREGLSYRAIADRLGVSEKTARRHCLHIQPDKRTRTRHKEQGEQRAQDRDFYGREGPNWDKMIANTLLMRAW